MKEIDYVGREEEENNLWLDMIEYTVEWKLRAGVDFGRLYMYNIYVQIFEELNDFNEKKSEYW